MNCILMSHVSVVCLIGIIVVIILLMSIRNRLDSIVCSLKEKK